MNLHTSQGNTGVQEPGALVQGPPSGTGISDIYSTCMALIFFCGFSLGTKWRFPLFWCMIIYANNYNTKENTRVHNGQTLKCSNDEIRMFSFATVLKY